MEVLIVVDMQEALLLGEVKYDLASVIERINRLAGRVRARGGCVIFVQHDGGPGEEWAILSSMDKKPGDRVVRKTLNDAFFGTSLQSDLTQLAAEPVLMAGWATDFCVDATVRSAAALGFKVVVVDDCHTSSDRPHLSAQGVIEHHRYLWANLISPHPVSFACEADL